jgi:hypothetical protein
MEHVPATQMQPYLNQSVFTIDQKHIRNWTVKGKGKGKAIPLQACTGP